MGLLARFDDASLPSNGFGAARPPATMCRRPGLDGRAFIEQLKVDYQGSLAAPSAQRVAAEPVMPLRPDRVRAVALVR